MNQVMPLTCLRCDRQSLGAHPTPGATLCKREFCGSWVGGGLFHRFLKLVGRA